MWLCWISETMTRSYLRIKGTARSSIYLEIELENGEKSNWESSE
jgi:hypothetical protein